MTNIRLREDLDDINTHFQQLISVSKEALRRKKKNQSQFGELNQTIKDLTQQNDRLSKRIEDLEVEQQRTRRQSHALEGIALLAKVAKNL